MPSVQAASLYEHDGEMLEMQQWVQNLRRVRGVSLKQVADAVGVSRSQMSQFAAGKYRLNPEAFARLKEYRESIGELPQLPAEGAKRRLEFTVTENVRLAVYLAHECATKDIMGMLVGYSGAGKTTALRYFAKRRPEDVISITADPTFTTKELLRELGDRLGETISYGTSCGIKRKVVAALAARPRLVIIDEANQLVNIHARAGDSVKKLDTVRAIYDQVRELGGHIGVVLAGTPELMMAVLDGPPSLAQLRSRIRRIVKLNPPGEKDVARLLEGFNIAPDAYRMLLQRAVDTQNGGLRWLETTVNAAVDLIGPGGLITSDVVEEVDTVILDESFDF